jgi:hypothetical protein
MHFRTMWPHDVSITTMWAVKAWWLSQKRFFTCTKTLTVYIPRPGEGPIAVQIIFIGTQRVEHVKQFKYLGQIIDSPGRVTGKSVKVGTSSYGLLIRRASRNMDRQNT